MIRLHILMGRNQEELQRQMDSFANFGWIKMAEYQLQTVSDTVYAWQLINPTPLQDYKRINDPLTVVR